MYYPYELYTFKTLSLKYNLICKIVIGCGHSSKILLFHRGNTSTWVWSDMKVSK